MSEDALKKLEEQLKCPVCLSIYTDPKLLHCLHVYCTKCLTKLVVKDDQGQLSLSCPTCRHPTLIPANGVSGLQSAFRDNQLLEIWDDLKGVRHTEADLEKVVQEDDVTHLVSAEKKLAPYCSDHDGEELKLYCDTCGELICMQCTIRTHHSHKYDLVSEMLEKHREEIKVVMEPVEEKLMLVDAALGELDIRCSEVSNQHASIEADINDTIRRHHELLDVKKTELVSQLHQIAQLKMKGLESHRECSSRIEDVFGLCAGETGNR